jgi:hypothetical protein
MWWSKRELIDKQARFWVLIDLCRPIPHRTRTLRRPMARTAVRGRLTLQVATVVGLRRETRTTRTIALGALTYYATPLTGAYYVVPATEALRAFGKPPTNRSPWLMHRCPPGRDLRMAVIRCLRP